MIEKTCTKCLQSKPLDDFYKVKRKNKISAYIARCKKCTIEQTSYSNKSDTAKKSSRQASVRWKQKNKEKVKDYELLKTYGITLEDYNKFLSDQNYRCAICEKEFANNIRKDLYVDHCHSTMKVRGLLCQKCNMGLGLFDDNLFSLKKAISYLERTVENG